MDTSGQTPTPELFPEDQPVPHPLLDQRVRVVLARKGDPLRTGGTDRRLIDATVAGVLLRLTADGSAAVRGDDGTVVYCWPALDITEEPT